MAWADQKKLHKNTIEDRNMMKDPNKTNFRIYVGSIPTDTMTKEDMEGMFAQFGTVQGVLLNRGFGFVQFEEESSAAEALKPEVNVMFRGKKVDIKPARPFTDKKSNDFRDRSPVYDNYFDRGRDITPYPVDQIPFRSSPYPLTSDRANDCEIIVVSKKQTEYAEYIEMRLKKIGVTVDLLFPNEDVPVTRVLANIASRGSLYAIVVLEQNEEHRSLTLNILHGQPQEHRNMPLNDAINLLARNFEAYILREKANRPSEVSVTPATGPITALNLSDRHPEPIQVLLNLLADNRQLTVLQYDRVITYIQARRELQLKVELGDTSSTVPAATPVPAPTAAVNKQQAELQNRILSILNSKASSLAVQPVPAPTPVQPVTQTQGPAPILSDPNVQKAIDNLIQGDVLRKLSSGSANRF